MELSSEYIGKVKKVWMAPEAGQIKKRSAWWHSKQIIRHINKIICDTELDGWNAGGVQKLLSINDKYNTAISIGCGTASKELSLLEKNIVERFTCFELSDDRINYAEKIAKEKGLGNRIEFICGNFFESEYKQKRFDLVFWDNSLHHMPDAHEAVKVSKEILTDEGVFYCNDYIGESRFQWSDESLQIVNAVRKELPDYVFETKVKKYHKEIKRPSIEWMINSDPSEAADSENIIPAIKEIFENPWIKYTGGVMYLIGLHGIIENIPDYSTMMNRIIEIDDMMRDEGYSKYAFILARKNGDQFF